MVRPSGLLYHTNSERKEVHLCCYHGSILSLNPLHGTQTPLFIGLCSYACHDFAPGLRTMPRTMQWTMPCTTHRTKPFTMYRTVSYDMPCTMLCIVALYHAPSHALHHASHRRLALFLAPCITPSPRTIFRTMIAPCLAPCLPPCLAPSLTSCLASSPPSLWRSFPFQIWLIYWGLCILRRREYTWNSLYSPTRPEMLSTSYINNIQIVAGQ